MKKSWIIAAAVALAAIVVLIILLFAKPQSGADVSEPTVLPVPTGAVGNFGEPDWDL